MKTLLILILVSACGKNINHTKRNFIVSEPLKTKESESLPPTLTFQTTDHRVSLHSNRDLSYSFFEESSMLTQYFSYDLGHIHPDAIYQLETPIPQDSELYIHDLGKDLLVDPTNLKFNDEFLHRLNQNKSFFFLALKQKSPRLNDIVIKNINENKTILLQASLSDYLNLKNITPQELDLALIIDGKDDNVSKWWIKKGAKNHYQLIHASLFDIKDQFLKNYQYKKHVLKRSDAKARSFELSGVNILKVHAKKTMQDKSLHHFKKTYYTQIGELPYTCFFTEAKATAKTSATMTHQEFITSFIFRNQNSLQQNSWKYHQPSTLKIDLLPSTAGQFEVGIIARKCPTKMGPKIAKRPVNSEKELELVIESYVRNE